MGNNVEFIITDMQDINKEIKLCFGDFQKISIRTKNVDESNKFLNSLWREFNEVIPLRNKERCPWAYLPRRIMKDKSVVLFGSMNTGIGEVYAAVSYVKKGTIDDIGFLIKDEIKRTDENRKIINQVVANAIKRINEVYDFIAKCTLEGRYKDERRLFFENYKGKNFRIYNKNEESEFIFYGQGYDKYDFENKAIKKVSSICDFLSVQTNVLIDYKHLVIEKQGKNKELLEEYDCMLQEHIFADEEFIDFFPKYKERLIIQEKSIDMLEYIINAEYADEKVNGVIQSCRIFREGLEEEYILESGVVLTTDTKYMSLAKKNNKARKNMLSSAVTFYMSALENLTVVDYLPEKCSSCGQLKFEISNRIGNIVEKYMDIEMARVMKKIYAMRSGYLHSGTIYLGSNSGAIRPNLDISTGSNCVEDGFISVFLDGESGVFFADNVREWVSYIIRKECRACFIDE